MVQRALRAAADSPGYPLTAGSPTLRSAAVGWFSRRCGVEGLDPAAVLPTVGSKELVALLPTLLGLGPGDVVAHPALAYPTYDVGARIAGATPVGYDDQPSPAALVWVSSPANPTGRVRSAAELGAVVAATRASGGVLASDECYLELGWDAEPMSVLHPSLCGGSHRGLLAVTSLSKRSNMAGYRAGLVAGDPDLVARLLAVRKHAGLMVSGPVQAAMVAALDDDDHVTVQRERYRGRRDLLRSALVAAGFAVDHSEGGLYLWVRHPWYDDWGAVDYLAGLGILVAPGSFYGPKGAGHIRVALTATDERVAAAASRLAGTEPHR